MGAWIEIKDRTNQEKDRRLSRPSWARGLKLVLLFIILDLVTVAPLMGAWIEIVLCIDCKPDYDGRAPHGRVD